MRILITEKIAKEGLSYLQEKSMDLTVDYTMSHEQLLNCIGDYDALIVRSITQVNEALYQRATNLKVVGRAGNGVDNIDMDGATKRGILVVNTPDANTVSAAEHTISLLLSLARKIPLANTAIKGGLWDRSPFRGYEMLGKTLGIIGLGRIGTLVASRMMAFDMKVLAYDPYVPDKKFSALGVQRVDSLETLLKLSHVITVHTPKTKETIGMIHADNIKFCKPEAILVNCARGGIIDEKALYNALVTGKIAGAAIDVLADEPHPISPLLSLPNTVITPHLGADTYEAQSKVGESVAIAVYDALCGAFVSNAVNLPALSESERLAHLPYMHLAETLGKVYSQMSSHPIQRIDLQYFGESLSLQNQLLSAALLKGALSQILAEPVNYVNAHHLAQQLNIAIFQSEGTEKALYTNGLSAVFHSIKGTLYLEGAIGTNGRIRITSIDGYPFDLEPEGDMLLIENWDQPGMIGKIGSLLGASNINISQMNVSQKDTAPQAMMLLKTNMPLSHELVNTLSQTDGIHSMMPLSF